MLKPSIKRRFVFYIILLVVFICLSFFAFFIFRLQGLITAQTAGGGFSLEEIEHQRKSALALGSLAALLLIGLGSVLAFILASRFSRPMDKLIEGVEKIGQGKLDHRITIEKGGQLEGLGKAFNKMASDLKQSRFALEEAKRILEVQVAARTKELQELAESLESKVQQRTGQLQEQVNELEKFRRLTVGRELKMIELKQALNTAQSAPVRTSAEVGRPAGKTNSKGRSKPRTKIKKIKK